MTNVNITQAEADALIVLEKQRVDDTQYDYPGLGGALHIPLVSTDGRDKFVLDVSRSQVSLGKGTYQNRARGVVILARLDFGGAPHRNPDDAEIQCPHLHLYREGYGDKWAVPLPTGVFSDTNDRWQMLDDFMRYVNVTVAPNIIRGLFA